MNFAVKLILLLFLISISQKYTSTADLDGTVTLKINLRTSDCPFAGSRQAIRFCLLNPKLNEIGYCRVLAQDKPPLDRNSDTSVTVSCEFVKKTDGSVLFKSSHSKMKG